MTWCLDGSTYHRIEYDCPVVGEAEVVFAIDHAPGMNHLKEALEEAVTPCMV